MGGEITPGIARVIIQDEQWEVALATTPWELSRGLGGILAIPPQTGMLFDLGWEQTIQVTTVPMLFSLDIAFVSETLVVTEIYRNVPPGYLVTSEHPARFFLEVNAGEFEGVEVGDQASVELVALDTAPWLDAILGLMSFMVLGAFMVTVVGVFAKAMLGKPEVVEETAKGTFDEQLKDAVWV